MSRNIDSSSLSPPRRARGRPRGRSNVDSTPSGQSSMDLCSSHFGLQGEGSPPSVSRRMITRSRSRGRTFDSGSSLELDGCRNINLVPTRNSVRLQRLSSVTNTPPGNHKRPGLRSNSPWDNSVPKKVRLTESESHSSNEHCNSQNVHSGRPAGLSLKLRSSGSVSLQTNVEDNKRQNDEKLPKDKGSRTKKNNDNDQERPSRDETSGEGEPKARDTSRSWCLII